MRLALIAAVAENGVIGRDNALPWRLPGDLKYFRAVTMGKPVIMGRRTWESLGRALPGRTNIVVTRQAGYAAAGAVVVSTLEAAINEAARVASGATGVAPVDEAVVIGGAEIYAQAVARCDRLYLTEVHAAVDGDTYFPPSDRAQWREASRERHAASDNNPYGYSFVVYERD